MRHLIDFGDLTRQEWDELYQRAGNIMDNPQKYIDVCRGRVMASLFYEPSTRTNFSFQTAMLRLGGTVFGFADPNSSSVAKGETLKDTVKMVSGYADVIVMRTPWEGAAKAASLYSHVPVVNAGDGGHMHPTQTTADLTTITRLLGHVDGLSVGLCGDLKNGRTVHSYPVFPHLPTGTGRPRLHARLYAGERHALYRGHRPGGGHPPAGRAVYDPHPAGAVCGPPGV